jgi:transcriptional regulator with XRE-family HTH domain
LLREVLLAARREAGLSQVEVAELLGRPQTFVSKYEVGERRLDVPEFVAIARALSFDPVVLLRRFLKLLG